MSEQQAIEPVHARGVQVFANYPLVGSIAAAVEQPICASRPQMNSRPCAEVQHRDFRNIVLGPMRPFDVKWPPGTWANKWTIPRTSCAKNQLALLKMTAAHRSSGVTREERTAIARRKK